MKGYTQGDIVLIPFPFTNLSQTKRRPALIISNNKVNETGDYLLVQITSRVKSDSLSEEIKDNDYTESRLPATSYVRIHKIFCLKNHSCLSSQTRGATGNR